MKDIPRGDYQEYLELTKLILGGSIDRKNGYVYQIQRPGADHHARWMSKAIYILKMSLLIHQLDLHWRTKKKIQQMTLFAVFVYLESWFTAGSLFSAASNDIKLYNRIQKFQVINKQVSVSSTAVINRHTWYLTEDLIPNWLSLTKMSHWRPETPLLKTSACCLQLKWKIRSQFFLPSTISLV